MSKSIFYTLKHTDPYTVHSRSTQKDGVCNGHIFRNGTFRELKIVKKSNDLADLQRSYQNHSRNQRRSQWTEKIDRMLLQTTEEYLLIKTRWVRHIQTLGNDNKDAMLECESGFHQSEDKRKLVNCHKLRSSYVTSILITKLTFAMFLLKLSTLSAAIFLFVKLRTCSAFGFFFPCL